MELYIGNKNYSTWSLRAWLMLKKHGLNFKEIKLTLGTDTFYKRLENLSPTQKVPTLIDGTTIVWDSLAICEYINDSYLSGIAWPQCSKNKAKARALACEMHSGFMGIRNELPMNIRAKRNVILSEQAKKDIKRIETIWSEQHLQFKEQGGWLFDQWSIADAMFSPVVLRFKTYGIQINDGATAYKTRVLDCPSLQKWIADSAIETDIIEVDEAGIDVS